MLEETARIGEPLKRAGGHTLWMRYDPVGKAPGCQIRITNGKHTLGLTEPGASMFRVREDGTSTPARHADMVEAIRMIATQEHR